MKTHTDLKELLIAYGEYILNYQETIDLKVYNKDLAGAFLAYNSLALGKPEPLAKNKQTENSFDCDYGIFEGDNKCNHECISCRNNRLEKECRDASSR